MTIVTLFAASLAWADWAADSLYVCTDPPLLGILDIIPPFVHAGTDDSYLQPAWLVWLCWASLLAAAIALPLLVVGYLWWQDHKNGA